LVHFEYPGQPHWQFFLIDELVIESDGKGSVVLARIYDWGGHACRHLGGNLWGIMRSWQEQTCLGEEVPAIK
jgi:hypothetical protein